MAPLFICSLSRLCISKQIRTNPLTRYYFQYPKEILSGPLKGIGVKDNSKKPTD